MRLYGLRAWYVPHGTSGGWNVSDTDRISGIGDVLRVLRDHASHGRLFAFSLFDTEVPA